MVPKQGVVMITTYTPWVVFHSVSDSPSRRTYAKVARVQAMNAFERLIAGRSQLAMCWDD